MRSVALAMAVLSLALAPGAAGVDRQVPPYLVFERNGDLYRIALDGSETVRMTSTKAPEREPAVSPDRLTVAFIRGDDELWVSDLRGGNQRRVLGPRPASVRKAATDAPSWSPDGTTLYVGRSAQTRSGYCGSIYRVTASGRGLHRLRRGGGLDMEPAVSPDGQRIALLTEDCEPALCCDVVVVDRQGRPTSDLRNLDSSRSYDDVDWSPDGTELVLAEQDERLDVVKRDGSRLRVLTPSGLTAFDPAWSPDGAWIAFAGWRGTGRINSDLFVIHPDGSGLMQITSTKAPEGAPSWLPRS